MKELVFDFLLKIQIKSYEREFLGSWFILNEEGVLSYYLFLLDLRKDFIICPIFKDLFGLIFPKKYKSHFDFFWIFSKFYITSCILILPDILWWALKLEIFKNLIKSACVCSSNSSNSRIGFVLADYRFPNV